MVNVAVWHLTVTVAVWHLTVAVWHVTVAVWRLNAIVWRVTENQENTQCDLFLLVQLCELMLS